MIAKTVAAAELREEIWRELREDNDDSHEEKREAESCLIQKSRSELSWHVEQEVSATPKRLLQVKLKLLHLHFHLPVKSQRILDSTSTEGLDA